MELDGVAIGAGGRSCAGQAVATRCCARSDRGEGATGSECPTEIDRGFNFSRQQSARLSETITIPTTRYTEEELGEMRVTTFVALADLRKGMPSIYMRWDGWTWEGVRNWHGWACFNDNHDH